MIWYHSLRYSLYLLSSYTDKRVDISNTALNRQQQGLAIANIDGAIKRINERKYVVKSQNGNGEYDICSTDLGWVCSCPDHKFRGVECKHIFAVEISFALRKQVEVSRIVPITTTTTCIYCDSSNIVKDDCVITNMVTFRNTTPETTITISQLILDLRK
jgi:hypothetical protein